MAQADTKHFNVLKDGKLSFRISAILDHYRGLKVNVEDVLTRELDRLERQVVKLSFLESDIDKVTKEPITYIKAKIQALKEILSVLNS